jgi:hypothetical protein
MVIELERKHEILDSQRIFVAVEEVLAQDQLVLKIQFYHKLEEPVVKEMREK